jgi:hypothetical protein
MIGWGLLCQTIMIEAIKLSSNNSVYLNYEQKIQIPPQIQYTHIE